MNIAAEGQWAAEDCETHEQYRTGDKRRASCFEKSETAVHGINARSNLLDLGFSGTRWAEEAAVEHLKCKKWSKIWKAMGGW